jgi:small-conductance mechanosensitive channel
MFSFLFPALKVIFNPETMLVALRVLAIIVFGFITLKLLVFFVGKAVNRRFTPQSAMITRKAIFYIGVFIILIAVLKQLGLKLAGILGAAGVAGIAIGIASQTSVSNLISGIFLISEKPFSVGDIIKVDATTGIILSIDLLSVKIRTFDNQFVRIPNEQLIKSQVTNMTRFPIRRLDVNITVSYREDISKVKNLLLEIAENTPYCLDNPEPYFLIQDFAGSGINLLFGIWYVKADFTALNNTIKQEIKERFEREGIVIPCQHISLKTDSPLAVRLADGGAGQAAPEKE